MGAMPPPSAAAVASVTDEAPTLSVGDCVGESVGVGLLLCVSVGDEVMPLLPDTGEPDIDDETELAEVADGGGRYSAGSGR